MRRDRSESQPAEPTAGAVAATLADLAVETTSHPNGAATKAVSFDRRRLLIACAGAAGFIALRPWRHVVDVVETSPVERLAGVLSADDGTRRVGQAYLRARPAEADVDVLVEALTGALDVGRDDLAAYAAEVVRAELRSRTIVRLDGWIASPTEARLAALTTLVHS